MTVAAVGSEQAPAPPERPIPRVLVVDDDDVMRDVLVRYLQHEGMEAVEAADGATARQIIGSQALDLVILDVMMPAMNGFEVCRWIRAQGDLPVIIVTARGELSDRITGLELGADDYVVKPFSPRELVVRAKAILRRSSVRPVETVRQIAIQHLSLNADTRVVLVHGKPVSLTATEFDLLWCLASHPQVVFSREQLLSQVWGYAAALDAGTSTVTVHARRLREKIEDDPSEPRIIGTVWGVGYRFEL
jgi:two-component system response regulator VicR